MKTAVVFYSLEGNTEFIAKAISNTLNADIFELKTKKVFPKSGFMKYFVGGMGTVLGLKPKLSFLVPDLSQYGLVILGSPVWAGKYASPFNTFLRHAAFKGKKAAFFACSGGGDASKLFPAFRSRLPGNDFIGEIGFTDPLKNNPRECGEKASAWAASLI